MPRRFLPWIVLAASLALTLLAMALLKLSGEARQRETFANAAEATRDRIEARVQTYTALLRGTAGLVSTAGTNLPGETFRAYVLHLGIAQHYPGVQGIGYSRRFRTPDDANAVTRQWSAYGHPDARLWPDTLATGAERHTIVYLEPQDTRNRVALGYNMHNDPVRRAAMDLARDTGQPALSGQVTLVQETGRDQQAGFLLYVPIYQGTAVPPTLAERRARLTGFAYAPFRADDLFLGLFGSEQNPRVAFRIYDGAPAPANRLHDSRTSGIAPDTTSSLTASRPLQLSGRTWTVVFQPTTALLDDVPTRLPLGLAATGSLLSILLFLLVRAQQRAAEALRVRERELDAFVHALPQLTWRADADGRIGWTNDRWNDFAGTPPETAHWPDVLGAALPPEAKDTLDQARAAKQPWEALVPLVGVHETRWFLARIEPVFDANGATVRWLGVFTDATEQYHAREADARALREQIARAAAEAREADLRVYTLELERSNRELQEFAHVASHDLQEPLRKIQLFADLVGQDAQGRLDDDALMLLRRIQSAAGRMSQLIKDVLAVSRLSQTEPRREPVDLNAVLATVGRDLWVRLEETDGRLDAETLPTLDADPTQMHQLLLNLVGNGLKFHREGVPPVVRVRGEAASLAPGRPALRLIVSDNGIGIEAQHLARIFAPFQRLHAHGTYEGTGIGLALCRRIVERHGGTLTVQSTPGEGTAFTATLPLRAER